MKQITREMLKIYKPISNMDWLNYKLVKKNLTFHHIIKRENGGKEIISNGALLMPIAHEYLHVIEYKDFKTYNYINDIFKIINTQQYEPTQDQREILECILLDFEHKHENDRTIKGKKLIKREYKERYL